MHNKTESKSVKKEQRTDRKNAKKEQRAARRKELRAEAASVHYPSLPKLLTKTTIVLTAMVCIGGAIAALDYLGILFVNLLL